MTQTKMLAAAASHPVHVRKASGLQWLALLCILAGATALRMWGAFSDLPYIYHPDEPQNIVAIQDMLANHDPNPHLFLYPSLLYEINVAAALLFKVVPAWVSGNTAEFPEPISITMGATYAPDAAAVALYRSVSIFGGVLSVFLIYLVGKRAGDVRSGLVAALLAAISPALIVSCQSVTPDCYVIVFELLAILASLAIVDSGRRVAYVAAGIAVGAAAASKYNGAVVCILPVAAHILRNGFKPGASGPLWLAAGASLAAFFVLNLAMLLDYQASWSGVVYQFHMYSGHHQGMEGDAPIWYARELWAGTGLASLLALGQIALARRWRWKSSLVLAIFALVYLCFISSFSLRNERTLLPAIPPILVLAALYFAELASTRSRLQDVSPTLRQAALAALGTGMVFIPLLGTFRQAIALTTVDSRTFAREWINSQLPPHSIVAVESYAPFVDPFRFRIAQAERAIDRTPSWYLANSDYVVLSQGMFGRYFSDPQKYPSEVVRYVQLVRSLEWIKTFDQGGYEISVYGTKKNPVRNSTATIP